MKRRCAILGFLLIVSFYLNAQHKSFQFGFKAGINMGWYNSIQDDYKNNGVNIGASWGFVADIFLMDNYSITTGFDVLYLNGTMTYPDMYQVESSSFPQVGILKRNYNTKYIKLPILFTMKTNEIKKLRYYGQIGFGISVLLTAKSKDEFSPDNGGSIVNESQNIYDELRPTRESIILGAGLEIPLHKSTYIRTGFLFDNTFVNILKGYNTLDPSIKNNGRNSFVEINVSLFF